MKFSCLTKLTVYQISLIEIAFIKKAASLYKYSLYKAMGTLLIDLI